jgi:hypothetical protein
MSKGSFKVIAELTTTLKCCPYEYDKYIMKTRIDTVESDPRQFSSCQYANMELFHSLLIKSGHLDCKINHSTQQIPNKERAICLDKLGLYVINAKVGNFVVDPCEKEHMQRFLAGTDDPLYDLVHELRYNPRIRLGEDVQEAESHFKKHQTE